MAEAVKVVVRCRPMNERENKLKCKVVVKMEESRGLCAIFKPDAKSQPPKEFTFDGVYHINSTTEQIYNDLAYPLVEGVVEGYNGTVFAYGQTGCGKSFSMQGIENPATQRGIIPRSFQHIFESVAVAENTKYLVHASYLEIYNEDVRDLLSKSIKERLELKEHPDKGVYVKDLTKVAVSNVKDCEKVMTTGWNNRAVGATLMNADSSRSHSIFTIYLEACDTGLDGKDHIRAGKLNLVDLAGSERQSKTGSTGDRLKEATKINLSLSALGNVISALVDGKSKHIPYRDSKLTRLLQDSLGGNTKTLMLACVSPADNNYDETLSTLRYANRAKNIKNKPRINEDPKDALLREYQEEIKKLKEMLASQGSAGTDAIKSDSSDVVADEPAGQSFSGPIPEDIKAQEEKAKYEKAKREKAEKARADKLKKEFQEKIDSLKKQYEAEQMSNVKLQQDMKKLQSHYEEKLQKSNAGATGATELLSHLDYVNNGYVTSPSSSSSSLHDSNTDYVTDTSSSIFCHSDSDIIDDDGDDDLAMYQQSATFMLRMSELVYNHALKVSLQRSIHGNPGVKRAARNIALASSAGSFVSDVSIFESSAEKKESEKKATKVGSKTITLPEDDGGRETKEDIMKQHEEALKRLHMLEQNMVGGEKSQDEEAKKKIVSRKQHVDERKRRLAEAAARDDEETMLDIYDSMNRDVKQSAKVIDKQKQKIEGLKMEIEDINYEFERDRSEYLSSIRRQEREIDFLKSILSKIHPTLRRDCNYSNLDKIRSDSKYDEDRGRWIVPDLIINKTTLPSAVSNHSSGSSKGRGGGGTRSPGSDYSPHSTSSVESYTQRSEEDRYLARLQQNQQDDVASNYFATKRQVKQIISSSYNDPRLGIFNQTSLNARPVSPTYERPPAVFLGVNGATEEPVRRPHKLESLSPASLKSKKKKKKGSQEML